MGLVTALATFLLGPFGVAVIVLGVAGAFIAATLQMLPPRAGFVAIACGGMAFIGAFLVRTYIASGF